MAMTGKERQARYVERQKAIDPEGWGRKVVTYSRNARRRNPERAVANSREWVRRNPEKNSAHYQVRQAVRHGTLTRPHCCESCARNCKPEAAHVDYEWPLLVLWLCRRCHVDRDFGGKA